MNPAIFLESILGKIPAQSVTNVFLVLLLAIFMVALFSAKRGTYQQFVQYTPNLLTSLGILGTFIGIVIGLLGFEATNIDGSIGPLLEGLKTAFITSLVGMLLAIFFKALDSSGLIGPPRLEGEPETATPEQILGTLNRQEQALVKLTRTIAGDEEATLISQIRLLRSDQSDQQKALREEVRAQKEIFTEFQARLWTELAKFAEMLSKSATEQIINALKEVIVDFNKNLTEQFGDNFKHLNEGVEKLVGWQENYRQQLEQMREQYAEGVKAIEHTRELVGQIEADTNKIPQTMEALKTIIETAQHQLAELERHLEAFTEMRDQAIEAIPEIKAQVDSIVEDVSAAAKESGARIYEVTKRIEAALEVGIENFSRNVYEANESLATVAGAIASKSGELGEQLRLSVEGIKKQTTDLASKISDTTSMMAKTLIDSNAKLKGQIEQVQEAVSESINQVSARVEKTMEELTRHHLDASSRASHSLSNELEKSVQLTGEAVNTQLKAIDEALEQEIQRVMSNMGQALAQISNAFTTDYRRLTEQMQEVVNQGRRVQ